jgi:hypothetical protein
VWDRRHRGIVALVLLNALGLGLFGLVQGYRPGHVLLEAGVVVVAGAGAWFTRDKRALASVFATLGLVTASAILVHFSHGNIEAHFHFFVMVTIIILYQDWLPFLLAIAYVVTHHAFFGLADPHAVFNHPAALNSPVKWALIHGAFIMGATIAGLTVWKQNENLRASYQETARRLAEAKVSQRDALDVNDNVLQQLVVAKYAFELGMDDAAHDALERSLAETQKMVSQLLRTSLHQIQPGELARIKDSESVATE